MDSKYSKHNRAMADTIRAELSARRHGNTWLAKETGISLSQVNRLLGNREIRDINITQIAEIAKALGMTTVDLVREATRREAHLTDEQMSEVATQNVTNIRRPQEADVEELENGSYRNAAHPADPEVEQDDY